MKNYEAKVLRAQKESTLAFMQGLYDEALSENQKSKVKFNYKYTENGVDIKEVYLIVITAEGERSVWETFDFENATKYAEFLEMMKTLENRLAIIKESLEIWQ